MVDFIEEKKRQKRLIYVMIIVLLTTFSVIWFGFLRKPAVGPVTPSAVLEFEKVEINFSLLEAPVVKELESFEVIPRFEGEIGRTNPFLPF